jgi:hypothetical protein
MVKYTCNICGKIYENITDYNKHKNRKFSCGENYDDICDITDKNFCSFINDLNNCKCFFCQQIFSNKYSTLRHIKNTCKQKNKEFKKIKTIKKENNDLKKENDALKKLINDNLINKENLFQFNSNTLNNNQTNIINNNVQNIALCGYGDENLDKIDKKILLNGINKVYGAPLYLTEAIHFNEKYPEFSNIFINSMKDKYAMEYDGKRWNLVDKNKLIDRIYEDKKIFVEEQYGKIKEYIPENKKERLEEWFENDSNPHDKGISEIKEEMKLLLYNKRHIPMKRKEQMENDIRNNLRISEI